MNLVILPTYNEAENIGRLIIELLEVEGLDILVVDDSSPDGTQDIVSRIMKSSDRVYLISREKKQGLSLAYQAGFSWGLKNGYRNLIQMDADFSHRPSDVSRFISELKTHDVVIGCRYMKGGGIDGWPWFRRWISRTGNWYAEKVLSVPYLDLTGGFNGWRREVFERILQKPIRSKGYSFQVELKYRAHQAGFSIKEMPIVFENRLFGESKMTGLIVWEAALRVFQLRKA